MLLKKTPKIDLCDIGGSSPLKQASQNGHTDIVKLLLDMNPDVDLCDKSGCCPLQMASTNGHLEIVRMLLKKTPEIDLCDIVDQSTQTSKSKWTYRYSKTTARYES
ncbi:Hypothetical predicted protein [Mytilus galloprovincialis]|uniref:Uncharacterized protein n=1 Tax=Mytilus galloprovincialis TaxID=29158 RepID=A0A8B6CUC1_MYTGA|nr:Hypothetical predicted protein [Mytilus galloprovincialis]